MSKKFDYSNGLLHDLVNSPHYRLRKRLVEQYKLTPKEVDLTLEMYKHMRPNKQLADDLQISVNTLIGRIHNIYTKLSLTSRNQLIIKMVELMELDRK